MKIQDIIFLIALLFLIVLRNPRFFVFAGLASLVISIPLFAKWIFFTAERLTWYAGGFFLLAMIGYLRQSRASSR